MYALPDKGKDRWPVARPGRPAPAAPVSGPGARPTASACACGGRCPRCRAASVSGHEGRLASDRFPLHLAGALSTPSSSSEEVTPEVPETGPSSIGEENEGGAEPLAGNSGCPVNAEFLSNVAGAGKAGCQVPDGQSGASRLAQYIVRGVSPIPSGGLSIGERFTALEDPYNAVGLLNTVTATTDASGKFDDCYILASKSALPPDFVLKVAQNHLYNGQAISRNVITYTPGNVGVRHCRRKPGSCDFNEVCRLA